MRLAVVSIALTGGCFEEGEPVSEDSGTTAVADSSSGAQAGSTTTGPGSDGDSTGDPPGTAGSESSGDGTTAADATTGGPDDSLILYGTPPLPGDLTTAAGGMGLVQFVDAQCTMPPPFAVEGCTQARAIIRLPGFELSDLGAPTGRPIVSPMGMPIANNIGLFLAGSFQTTPADAGVLAKATEFWTGAGALGMDDCQGWASPTASGTVGRTDESGGMWLNSGLVPCEESRPLLCLCWTD